MDFSLPLGNAPSIMVEDDSSVLQSTLSEEMPIALSAGQLPGAPGASQVPSYDTQFSSTTSLILERIKNKSFNAGLSDASNKLSTPDREAFEDAKSRLMRDMNTTVTLSTPDRTTPSQTPQIPPSIETLSLRMELERAKNKDDQNKRKREAANAQRGPDFSTQASVDLPTRLIPKPRRHPATGKPFVSLEDIDRKEKIERIRKKRLASLPEGAAPARPDLVGFEAGGASTHARTQYFSRMKSDDILSILSFCDRLRPQLLTDVMVSISKQHPDLPMFSSPTWSDGIPEPPPPPMSAAQQFQKREQIRPRAGPSLLNSKAKQKIKGRPVLKKPLKRSRLSEEVPVAGAEPAVEEVEEDPLPPSWPKPGEGLYAKLASELEDRIFLVDGNDEEVFSHFMVDKLGRQIIPV